MRVRVREREQERVLPVLLKRHRLIFVAPLAATTINDVAFPARYTDRLEK